MVSASVHQEATQFVQVSAVSLTAAARVIDSGLMSMLCTMAGGGNCSTEVQDDASAASPRSLVKA